MAKRGKSVPQHRHARSPVAGVRAPRNVLRAAAYSSVAVVATLGVVLSGVAANPTADADRAHRAPADRALAGQTQRIGVAGDTFGTPDLAKPGRELSRSGTRTSTDQTEEKARSRRHAAVVTGSYSLGDSEPHVIALVLMHQYGWKHDQVGCLDSLYQMESGWRSEADNPTSSAYGIPQALTSLHELPPDYMFSAEAQIRWGLEYIHEYYGTPCAAWTFWLGHNWY